MTKPKLKRRPVTLARPTYQPSKAELEVDTRVAVTFEQAVDALTRPVLIRHIGRQKRHFPT